MSFTYKKGPTFDYAPIHRNSPQKHGPEPEREPSPEWRRAVEFLTGQAQELTPDLKEYLRRNMFSEATIRRLETAKRQGARLGARVNQNVRMLSHILQDSRFEWNPPTADVSSTAQAPGTTASVDNAPTEAPPAHEQAAPRLGHHSHLPGMHQGPLSLGDENAGPLPAEPDGTFDEQLEAEWHLFLEDFGFAIAPSAADARHDYSADEKQALGEGDEAFKPNTRVGAASPSTIKQVFPSTPDGVVQAALYELHRGEMRSLGDIASDPTRAKYERGPAAATEGVPKLNRDAPSPQITSAQAKAGLGLRGSYETEDKLAALLAQHKDALDRLAQLLAKKRQLRTKEEAAELVKLTNDPTLSAVRATVTQRRSQPVGHLVEHAKKGKATSHEIGGVRAALETGAEYDTAHPDKKADPWCGSFAAYIYARCGLDVGKGFASAYKLPRKLSTMRGSTVYMRTNTHSAATGERMKNTSPPPGHKGHKDDYFASNTLSQLEHVDTTDAVADVRLRPKSISTSAAAEIDIRPGDIAWTMHNVKEGHVMVVVSVAHRADGVDIATVEGNKGDRVQALTHTISIAPDGTVTGDIVGWGRPPQLGTPLQPPDRLDPALEDVLQHQGKRADEPDR